MKSNSRTKLELLCAKKGAEKHLILKKQQQQQFQNGQNCSHVKSRVTLGQKLKLSKTCQKHSRTTLELFCARKRLQKTVVEKGQHFQNDQNWRPCKGYTPCKIVTLGQKQKVSKTCEKHHENHIRFVLCKKTGPSKHLVLEKGQHFQNGQNWLLC